MSAKAARAITAILRESPAPDGRLARILAHEARPIAYKTGPSYGLRDAWAVGYSPSWTIGVWVGRSDGTPRPGAYGRNTAAPALFALFDRLPTESAPDTLAEVPSDDVANADSTTPLGLKRFAARDVLVPAIDHHLSSPLQVLFPPQNGVIELAREAGETQALSLEARGGTPPYSWLVNGLPVTQGIYGADTLWKPDGPGFARKRWSGDTLKQVSMAV